MKNVQKKIGIATLRAAILEFLKKQPRKPWRFFEEFEYNPLDRGRLTESAVGAYLLSRAGDEGFEVYWWRERSNEVDFVIKKGSKLTAIEVKSGRVKNVGGSLVFKKQYPEALSLVVGSTNLSVEDFLLGKQVLFL
ncbi:MAG: DUF4143 domain-containing protein [Oscillospiraceae bacterium]|nr:DUF4143 domain-containing protein [Oscillospiraceae bacterium]